MLVSPNMAIFCMCTYHTMRFFSQERETETETDRETDRQTDRERDRQNLYLSNNCSVSCLLHHLYWLTGPSIITAIAITVAITVAIALQEESTNFRKKELVLHNTNMCILEMYIIVNL